MENWTCQKQGYILEVQDPIQCSKSNQNKSRHSQGHLVGSV